MSCSLVSIITPTYNCGRFIGEAIKSVQSQTYTNWEMIVFDDASDDGTDKIVAGYAQQDSRIRYFSNASNLGAAVTRNKALRQAKGRWIAFLDGDDLWASEKLERQIRFMEENGYGFSYHGYVEINESSQELGVYVDGIKRVTKFLMYCCCWPGCLSVMYDADVVGLVQIANLKKNNDVAIWLKIVETQDCHLLKENLGFYRRRKDSISSPNIGEKIFWHYILFRKGIGKNWFISIFWVCMNLVGNAYKKMFCVKKYNPGKPLGF